jgi:hypothetical protein
MATVWQEILWYGERRINCPSQEGPFRKETREELERATVTT